MEKLGDRGNHADGTPAGSVFVVLHDVGAHLVLSGQIDETVADDLRRGVALIVAERSGNDAADIVIEMSEVTFADSTLVNGLAALRGSPGQAGPPLVVQHPSPQVHQLLTACDLPYVTLRNDLR